MNNALASYSLVSTCHLDIEVSTRAFETQWMTWRALCMSCPWLEVASAMKGAAGSAAKAAPALPPAPPPGVFRTGYTVIQLEGYRGLYKGLSASLMRQVRPGRYCPPRHGHAC